MAAPEVSHGRGGAGNINPDDTQYVDGEVVRVGVEGSHGDGAFSTGRGGEASPFAIFSAMMPPPRALHRVRRISSGGSPVDFSFRDPGTVESLGSLSGKRLA